MSHETGRPITVLIVQALEELQECVHIEREIGVANGHESESPVAMPQEVRTPIWEAFIEASLEIPDEELDLLPTDGATQHDHYIYGTPNRPV